MSDSNAIPEIDQRIYAASAAVINAQGQLASAIQQVGMTNHYAGSNPHAVLQTTIENYARAVARHEMLVILRSEDFFLAMARSAGASNLDP